VLRIKLQTSSGERSAATPAGKATAEDPRRVGFSSVADSMKNELQFFAAPRKASVRSDPRRRLERLL